MIIFINKEKGESKRLDKFGGLSWAYASAFKQSRTLLSFLGASNGAEEPIKVNITLRHKNILHNIYKATSISL